MKTLVGGAAGLSLARSAFGEQGTGPITAAKLTDNIHELTGAGCNVLLVVGSDGLLLVDGGLAESSTELLKVVASQSKAPIQFLFNTDWHREHTGLNETAGKAGAKIVSHENTKLWLTTDIDQKWQKKTYKPLPAGALPNQTFYNTGKMTFGQELIQYGYMPQAHTDGDIYVFLPVSNILMTGDVVTVGKYPILDYTTGGWIGGLNNASKALLALANKDTKVIPSSGPILTKADLQAQSDMCATVYDRLVKMMRRGRSAKDMIAEAPTKEFDAKWGNPELFISNAYHGLWGHVREIGGIV